MDLNSNKYYVMALEFIKSHDLNTLPKGRNDIDGDNLYVNIIETSLKTKEEAGFEAHDRYIDIQVPISGGESYGVKARALCTKPVGEMDVEKDCILFDTETAHAPCIGEGPIKKAVFKVKAR